ncbi:primary-amine oxidase [Arthrobacter sp. Y-9]|uniref:primary-amine oxidase n=1 Tax=Arthrobacter sp. Y-9 TaxID=3039385 RepID=UPI00241F0405|nr:primary-amine oxidase [Arthrobacter sp. Y-9]WFR82685.1 primary-amine oxidase [Arthrobacter sp. Y-9]
MAHGHTDTTLHTHGERTTEPREVAHPLDPLTAEEIARVRAVLDDAGLLGATVRVPQLLPLAPEAAWLDRWQAGAALERRVEVVLLDVATGEATRAVVLLSEPGSDEVGIVESVRTIDTDTEGQPQYLFEEYDRVERIVKDDPSWQAAMERRGLGDRRELAFCAPLAPGHFGREDESGTRVIRSLTFLRDHEGDSPWAHPVEGLVVHIDLTRERVIRVEDEGDVPVPEGSGDYSLSAWGPARESLKPIEITQPEGPSFQVDGSKVTWENWSFRVGFNAREGLVLNALTFRDGTRERSVLRRASVPEMVVPYGDTAIGRYWISYFDAGEYLLGKNANALTLGCDCLGVIHYFDQFVADDHGHPVKIPHAVCMHEEDYGILWKHTDTEGNTEVRRSRRLVISYFSTIGNYDYGFFWYLYLDGTIQLEAKATGIVFAGAGHPGAENPHAPEVAPGVFAPVHQHLFCARLETAVDTPENSLYEVEVRGVPTGPSNPYGNAFTWEERLLPTESTARRKADPAVGRVWEVRSGSATNAVGRPTAYRLHPHTGPVLMAQPEATVFQRATFATEHLWATPLRSEERFPAGDFPNANPGGAGLPAWTAADRPLEDERLVLWHVFGPTHVPRTEDWPIMPVDYSGFSLKPHGFLDRNPALDLADGATSAGAGCCGGAQACTCH